MNSRSFVLKPPLKPLFAPWKFPAPVWPPPKLLCSLLVKLPRKLSLSRSVTRWFFSLTCVMLCGGYHAVQYDAMRDTRKRFSSVSFFRDHNFTLNRTITREQSAGTIAVATVCDHVEAGTGGRSYL